MENAFSFKDKHYWALYVCTCVCMRVVYECVTFPSSKNRYPRLSWGLSCPPLCLFCCCYVLCRPFVLYHNYWFSSVFPQWIWKSLRVGIMTWMLCHLTNKGLNWGGGQDYVQKVLFLFVLFAVLSTLWTRKWKYSLFQYTHSSKREFMNTLILEYEYSIWNYNILRIHSGRIHNW